MAFDERFDIIEESTSEELIDLIKLAYDEHYGETNSETSWDVFTEFAQLKVGGHSYFFKIDIVSYFIILY